MRSEVLRGDVDYSISGIGYASQRQTDPRIACRVHEALGSARTILNIGAGAGSYEPLDRHVLAIEPSATMRAQRPTHLSPAVIGYAESLPLDDQSVDAAMAMVTIHQWTDAERGIGELRRVTRGSIAILTFDGDALDRFWLAEYAPELIAAERKRYPEVEWIGKQLGGAVTVEEISIPVDCVDGFTEAFYARPEKFLDPSVRKSQSAWSFISDQTQDRIVENLRQDLESGEWEQRLGHWRSAPNFVGSLRLILSVGR